jgi:hypothetical protein
MVKPSDIATAINNRIAAAFPGYMVYPQRCPKDFVRPSFLLEYVRTSKRDANRSTVEKTVYFTITCFETIDKYYRQDPDKLAELQEAVLELFSCGHVPVGDRAIKVQSSTGGMDFDRAYVDLQCQYFDERTDAEDTTPLMQSVITNLQEG